MVPMGMSPTVFRAGPYRFFFFSNEGHEAAHVHVQRDDRLAKFWLDPVDLAGTTAFPPHELHRIRALVLRNRRALLEAWNEFFAP